MNAPNQPDASAIGDHRRQWRNCRYVYPVISRRARGVSIGVNLNLDKKCTFACRYCQINRRIHRLGIDVEIPRLRAELDEALDALADGELWNEPRFVDTPSALRRVNDIALSGDGEPTCLESFDAVVATACEALDQADLPTRPLLVVITNATRLDSPQVYRALPLLDAHPSEIWAKLDAGTEAFFREVNRPAGTITLESICENLLMISRDRPIVIQTLFFLRNGSGPGQEEIDAYAGRLESLRAGGGQISRVQLHTIARAPAESDCTALPDARLDEIAAELRGRLANVAVEVFYGRDVPSSQPEV
jgi:wyosine [tRNA(Phe)-imidazoG37] synthetase (radical SAM superfamily)